MPGDLANYQPTSPPATGPLFPSLDNRPPFAYFQKTMCGIVGLFLKDKSLEPELGLNELAQAGALEALRTQVDLVARRAQTIVGNRAEVTRVAREHGFDVPDSQANVLWLSRRGVDGAELSRRFEVGQVVVAPGGPLGDAAHVRMTVPARDDHMQRALRAIELAAEAG